MTATFAKLALSLCLTAACGQVLADRLVAWMASGAVYDASCNKAVLAVMRFSPNHQRLI